jgi:TPP-dependent pyruvate/acetoin dehydrogenase alpha subunit
MSSPSEPSRAVLWGMLERMAKTRLVELLIAQKYPEQKMKCPTHLCLGQEAPAAVLGTLAGPGDIFFGNYRSHGHYISRGGRLRPLFSEILGMAEGCSGGLGGSMHLIDLENGFFGSSAIVASTVPIAAGAAMKFKLQKSRHVAVVFFGDGAMEEGVVYETVNLAVLHNLPLILVCENNRLAILTPIEQRASTMDLHARFGSLGMTGTLVDAGSPESMITATAAAYASAREGRPVLLEFPVRRWAVHVGHAFQGPVDAWWQTPRDPAADSCPLAATVRLLLDRKLATQDDVSRLRADLLSEVTAAYDEALKGSPPAVSLLTKDTAAGPLLSRLPHAADVGPTSEPHREQSPLVNPF